MIVLDTNVLSSLMRREPDAIAKAWLDQQSRESVWTTAITIFEISFGLALLQSSRRKDRLELSFSRMIAEDFQGRVLSFDEEAARRAGLLAAERRRMGTTPEFRDIEIAAIVLSREATLATHNVRHFQDLGIELIDPWSSSGVR